MKEKLSLIRKPLHRFLITCLVNVLLLISKFRSARARVHWVGGPRKQRHERALAFVLVLGSWLVLKPHQYAWWSVIWGGFFAIFVNLYSLYIVIPRKQYHWVKSP